MNKEIRCFEPLTVDNICSCKVDGGRDEKGNQVYYCSKKEFECCYRDVLK